MIYIITSSDRSQNKRQQMVLRMEGEQVRDTPVYQHHPESYCCYIRQRRAFLQAETPAEPSYTSVSSLWPLDGHRSQVRDSSGLLYTECNLHIH